jgi:hypothetical protein
MDLKEKLGCWPRLFFIFTSADYWELICNVYVIDLAKVIWIYGLTAFRANGTHGPTADDWLDLWLMTVWIE